MVIVYWSVLQVFATAACPPLSGLMYQASVVLPLLPQAASTPAAVARAADEPTRAERCPIAREDMAPRDRVGTYMCVAPSTKVNYVTSSRSQRDRKP